MAVGGLLPFLVTFLPLDMSQNPLYLRGPDFYVTSHMRWALLSWVLQSG